jgi:hypothetical protein
MTTRYVVRDRATRGVDFLLWADDEPEQAQQSLDAALADGLDVELVTMPADQMDAHTARLITGQEQGAMNWVWIDEAQYARFEAASEAARPVDDADWGSERQASAQNAFFESVEGILHPDEFRALEDYCLHATSDEMIDRAMALLVEHLPADRERSVAR